jgi:hypothetical protein
VDHYFGLDVLPLPQRSWLYTGDSFGQTAGLTGICSSPRHTWVARYSASKPVLGYTLWQCTNGTTGVNITSWPGCGKIDTSITSLTLSQLVAVTQATAGVSDVPVPAVDSWTDASGTVNHYHARIDPNSNDIQYMGPDTSFTWVNITGSNASGGVSMAISESGEKVICYTNLAGHTAQYVAAPGSSTWAWQDLG